MITFVQGGVFLKIDGVEVSFKPKCEKCGFLNNCIASIKAPASALSSKETSSFQCPLCGNDQKIEVIGKIA